MVLITAYHRKQRKDATDSDGISKFINLNFFFILKFLSHNGIFLHLIYLSAMRFVYLQQVN